MSVLVSGFPGERVLSNGENMKNNGKQERKTAVITGASSGIGEAAALRLAQEGCNLFLIARREKNLKELKKNISSYKVSAEYAAGDVTDKDFVSKAISRAQGIFGPINILVLSAGTAFINSFNSTSIDDFRSILEVNSFGVINCCKEAVKRMASGGSIVLITSPAGIHGAKGMTAYALSKGGIIAFGKSLALELAPKKIRVNIISPGFVRTELTQKLYGHFTETQKQQIEKSCPLGVGEPMQVANAINFLTSDESSWITGAVLPVDGGLTVGK